MVTSSCVGPTPPLVNSQSCAADSSRTSRAMVSTSSITTTTRRSKTQRAKLARQDRNVGLLDLSRENLVADDERSGRRSRRLGVGIALAGVGSMSPVAKLARSRSLRAVPCAGGGPALFDRTRASVVSF
jgi:hypothetical protein